MSQAMAVAPILVVVDSQIKKPKQMWRINGMSMISLSISILAIVAAALHSKSHLKIRSSSIDRGANAVRKDAHFHQATVHHWITSYQAIVASFVQQQTMSWQTHYCALEKDTRTESQRAQARHSLATNPSYRLSVLKQDVRSKSRLDMKEKEPFSSTIQIWDYEEDVPLYLEQLGKGCASDAVSDEYDTQTGNFNQRCWDRLHDLIETARCTTRLDSRYLCQGQDLMRPTRTGTQILERHFRHNTINVLILGAGPVGLLLANGLAGIATDPQDAFRRVIRIVVMETRLYPETNIKKPYSRNWITDLDHSFLQNILDPLIDRFIQTVHEGTEFRVPLPIEAIETLLLLSCRHRGVQFLYDDYRNYQDILESTPNLVVFDATGARLDNLAPFAKDREVRTTNMDTPSFPVTGIKPWSWHPMEVPEHFRYFLRDQYQYLAATNNLVHLGQQDTGRGVRVIPVVPITTKTTVTSSSSNAGPVVYQPYVAHMLKVNDLRIEDYQIWEDLEAFETEFTGLVSTYCESRFSPCYRNPLLDDWDEERQETWIRLRRTQEKDVNKSQNDSHLLANEQGRLNTKFIMFQSSQESEESSDHDEESGSKELDQDEETRSGDDETLEHRDGNTEDEKANQDEEAESEDGDKYDRKTCSEWCGRYFVYNSPGFYRKDIEEFMYEQRPDHLGLTVLLSSITSTQADAIWYLLGGDPSTGEHRQDLELRHLPLAQMADLKVFRGNGFEKLLRFLAHVDIQGKADASLFSYQPYMYQDPVVPGGLFGNDKVPLLRIGNSLASGDPNLGTGLGFHVQVVNKLIGMISHSLFIE